MVNNFNAQHHLLKAGGSILSLAYAIGKIRAGFSKQGTEKAKQGYTEEANKIAENKRLIEQRKLDLQNKKLDLQEKNLKIKARDLRTKDKVSKYKAQQIKNKIAGSEAKTQTPKSTKPVEKFEFAGETPITPANSQTNINASNPDVEALIEVKQKNALRAAAGRNSANAYQEAIANSDLSAEDSIAGLNLDANITDKDLKSSGLTKTDLINLSNKDPQHRAEFINKLAQERGIDEVWVDPESEHLDENLGPALSRIIMDKQIQKERIAAEEANYADISAEESQPMNYFVWDESNIDEDEGGIVF